MQRTAATVDYRPEALAAYRPEAPAVYRPDSHDASGPVFRANKATSRSPLPGEPGPDRGSPPSYPMSRRNVVTTPSDGPLPARARPLAAHSPGTANAPAASLTIEPSSSSTISLARPPNAPDDPEAIRSSSLDIEALPRVKAPPSAAHRSGTPSETQVQRLVIGAMAPRGLSRAAHDVPPEQVASEGGGVHSVRVINARLYTAAGAIVQPTEALESSAVAEPTQTESESRQGMLVLDGAQLGRWMIDHLEHRASRPGAMTTGIDPHERRASRRIDGMSRGRSSSLHSLVRR